MPTNTNVATRCPHCGHYGTFENVSQDIGVQDGTGRTIYTLGLKKCPNANCQGNLFFIKDGTAGKLLQIYPPETVPFDTENIPQKVLNAFQESINCHSNSCYIASALMIRKTLEEICLDRGANGKVLKDRLKSLGSKILIPKELIDGMDDLRLLGNDAAHVEAQTFNEIGKEEIEVSLEFTKEILKGVYQYEKLLEKLKGLKDKKENINEA